MCVSSTAGKASTILKYAINDHITQMVLSNAKEAPLSTLLWKTLREYDFLTLPAAITALLSSSYVRYTLIGVCRLSM
jgi:hypothetical protein